MLTRESASSLLGDTARGNNPAAPEDRAMRTALLPVLFLLPALVAPAAAEPVPEWASGTKFHDPLSGPDSAANLVFSDPAVWSFGKDAKGGGFLELKYDPKTYKSSYTPKHRSPVHIALFKQLTATDFVMDLEMQSTIPAYGHQDLCLFFGFESPQKYYYVHIAREADMNAHNVFIVNDAPRKNIAKTTTKGIDWKADTWHHVRLARQGSTGKIEVFFDDLKTPIMTAEDKTFPTGYVGFGSFDDTGRFRNVRVSQRGLTLGNEPTFFRPLGK